MLITSAKKHVFVAVCPCAKYLSNYKQILMIFQRKNVDVTGTNGLACGLDRIQILSWILDHFSGFFTIS